MAEVDSVKKIKIMFARFPGGNVDRKEITDWLIGTVLAAKADPRIDDDLLNWSISDTPITMGRNLCMEVAKQRDVDFVLMIDNDMSPDLYLGSNCYREYADPSARPFFQSSFDFALQQRRRGEPCCIGAPYCGPPPHENIYVFHWTTKETNRPIDEADMSIEQYSREHAVTLRGIQEAAALPTGLILIDMQVLKFTDPPYFYYEWDDVTESKKASTEDVTFTRNLSLNGCPQFCNWDAWAGHFKMKCVGRPKTLSARSLNSRFRRRVLEEYNITSPKEQLIILPRRHERNGHATKTTEKPEPAGVAE